MNGDVRLTLSGGFEFSFLPINRQIIDPIDLEEAFCRAILGVPSFDTEVWVNDHTGEVKVQPPGGSIEAARDQSQRLLAGQTVINKALLTGEICAFIIQDDRFLRIHRLYWLHHGPVGGDRILAAPGVPRALVGKDIMVDPDHLAAWSEIATRSLPPEVPNNPGVTSADVHGEDDHDHYAVVSTAKAIRDCAEWLCAEFAKCPQDRRTKPEFCSEALRKFEARLSGRGFAKAWAQAVIRYPDRAKAGAKTKSKRP